MRTQLRIVAGSLRGRRLDCSVNPKLRPLPQRVREALFSILGDAVPGREFYDVFAGTGSVGLEAVSRGASQVYFVERDGRSASDIAKHLGEFGVTDRAQVLRTDTYRWVEYWSPPNEPINLFLGPPFADYQERLPSVFTLIEELQGKCALGSVIVLQGEATFDFEKLPRAKDWEQRKYGRNWLLIWVHEAAPAAATVAENA